MKIVQRAIIKDALSVAGRGHNERVIRVPIADDQEVVRTGFRVILEADGDIQVVDEADNGKEARPKTDVVVIARLMAVAGTFSPWLCCYPARAAQKLSPASCG